MNEPIKLIAYKKATGTQTQTKSLGGDSVVDSSRYINIVDPTIDSLVNEAQTPIELGADHISAHERKLESHHTAGDTTNEYG